MDRATLQTLALEHEKHARQIELLERAVTLCSFDSPELARCLGAVDEGLVEHLRWEEAELFPWLLEVLPHCADQVERLEREHVDLVAAATVLGMMPASRPQSLRAVVEAARHFVQLLRRHLEHEERLIAAATLADPTLEILGA